jgi:hypothetical protein
LLKLIISLFVYKEQFNNINERQKNERKTIKMALQSL